MWCDITDSSFPLAYGAFPGGISGKEFKFANAGDPKGGGPGQRSLEWPAHYHKESGAAAAMMGEAPVALDEELTLRMEALG